MSTPSEPGFDHEAHHGRLLAAARTITEGPLPFHYPTCFGCGPDAEQGLHLQVRRAGEEILAEVTFMDRHAGAPGIAHGGMVSSAVDDFLGFGMYLSPRTAVTRALEVDFRLPALVGTAYAMRGWVAEERPDRAWFACEATGPDGRVAFAGRALFVNVPNEHFTARGSAVP